MDGPRVGRGPRAGPAWSRAWPLALCLGGGACWDFELQCGPGGSCPEGLACNTQGRCAHVDSSAEPLGGVPREHETVVLADAGPDALPPANPPCRGAACGTPVAGPRPVVPDLYSTSDAGLPGADAGPSCGRRNQACCDALPACQSDLSCDPERGVCVPCAGFRGLGFYPGQTDSHAFGVSADGSLAFGYARAQRVADQAIFWQLDAGLIGRFPPRIRLDRGQRVELPSAVFAATSDGQIVAGYREIDVPRADNQSYQVEVAFQANLSGSLQEMFEGRALGISGDGSVLAGWSGDPSEAFRWTAASGRQGLGVQHALVISQANGVSEDGLSVVGAGALAGAESHALLWTAAGEMLDLGVLAGGQSSFATATNADGSVVVGGSDGELGRQAFRWTRAGAQLAGLAPLERANATDAAGLRIVGSLQDGAGYWQGPSGVVRRLDEELADLLPSGWVLREATGISADGTV
ncbi:MAG TPA: hypothetical protein VJU61_24305, partial [Polyangiaceae bacterium]|nr:hypothetical protein [Polyangiaceae bacterium]